MISPTISQAVLSLALFLVAETVAGSSFGVSPTRLNLNARDTAGMLTVRSQSHTETIVQLQVNAWSQRDGADVLEPSTDLIAVPPLFTLPPGGSQVIRVGLRRPPSADGELTYRLLLREVLPPPAEDFTGLQVSLNLNLPVFVLPAAGAAPELTWNLVRSPGGDTALHVGNVGDAHLQLKEIHLAAPSAVPRKLLGLPVYLLPGQSRAWSLESGAGSGRWKLSAKTDAGLLNSELVLD